MAPFKIFLVLTEGSKDSVSLIEAYRIHQQKDDAMAQPVTTVFQTTGKPPPNSALGDKVEVRKEADEKIGGFAEALGKVLENTISEPAAVQQTADVAESFIEEPEGKQAETGDNNSDERARAESAKVQSESDEVVVPTISSAAQQSPELWAERLPSLDSNDAGSTEQAELAVALQTDQNPRATVVPPLLDGDGSIENRVSTSQLVQVNGSELDAQSRPSGDLAQKTAASQDNLQSKEAATVHLVRGSAGEAFVQGPIASANQPPPAPIGVSVIALAATGRAGVVTGQDAVAGKDVEISKLRTAPSTRAGYPILKAVESVPALQGQHRTDAGAQNTFASGLVPASSLSVLTESEPLPLVQTVQSSFTTATASAQPVTAYGPSPDAAKAVAQQMTVAVNQAIGGVTELQLSPAELGKVRLILTTQDAGLVISVMAERPEIQDLLRRHIDVLGQEFGQLGYQDISFEFEQGASRHDDNDQTEQADLHALHQEEAPLQNGVKLIASAGLDLRL